MSTYGFGELMDKELNKENVFRLVAEERLWRHYLGFDYVIGKTYKSPLRTDPSPSFSIFYASRMQKIMAKDHGGVFVGDIIDYICFTERVDFYNALVKINLDFGLGLVYKRDRLMTFREHRIGSGFVPRDTRRRIVTFVYESVARPPMQADYDYWASYGITRRTLIKYGVGFVKLLYCNGVCCYTYQPENPCYEYPFPSGNRKYYWPFAVDKTKKFRGNIDNTSDCQGYWQCRVKVEYPNKMLVITKSMKDVMLLNEYGIDSIAIHGETQRFPKEFMEHLKRWYPVIVSLYDNDDGGHKGAEYLWKEYGIKPLFIPKESAKDLTDLYKKDRQKADEFVEKVIRRV